MPHALPRNTPVEVDPRKREVVQEMEESIIPHLRYLKPVEDLWQPTDFLPDLTCEGWKENLEEYRKASEAIPDELFVVLIGDAITEEALPTYQTAINRLAGVHDPTGTSDSPWAQWSKGWTAEENRHGDVLSRYLYLSGRVDMRSVEITTNNLLRNGFDYGPDPYKGFIYTSFQERATKISHGNCARLANEAGDKTLDKMCAMIASDEARHEAAYKMFVKHFLTVDPSGAMLSFQEMMKAGIEMPAKLMDDGSENCLFDIFSVTAQRTGVYTAHDYADIIEHLLAHWKIPAITGLTPEAMQAQEYLCNLPKRYHHLAEKVERKIARTPKMPFRWIFNRTA